MVRGDLFAPLGLISKTWLIRYSSKATVSLPTATSAGEFFGSIEPKRSLGSDY